MEMTMCFNRFNFNGFEVEEYYSCSLENMKDHSKIISS